MAKLKLTKGQLQRLSEIEDDLVRNALGVYEHVSAQHHPEDNLYVRRKDGFHSGNAERYMSTMVPDVITKVMLKRRGFVEPE